MSLGLYQQKLEALPRLYHLLMQAPRVNLNRGFLPHLQALYLFYRYKTPVVVGSPEHLDIMGSLSPSVRLGYRVQKALTAPVLTDLSPSRSNPAILSARWLPLEDPTDRELLELFVAERLSLPTTHPDLARLSSPPNLAPKQTADVENI